jgi:hypothetical protein
METRTCLECNATLRGRADQKFCNDSCRNSYNNKKQSGASKYMRKINRILKNNHSILAELNPNDKTTTYKSTLIKQGFNFSFFTNTYTTKTKRVYYFVYDQGYSELENNKYMLVKKEE